MVRWGGHESTAQLAALLVCSTKTLRTKLLAWIRLEILNICGMSDNLQTGKVPVFFHVTT